MAIFPAKPHLPPARSPHYPNPSRLLDWVRQAPRRRTHPRQISGRRLVPCVLKLRVENPPPGIEEPWSPTHPWLQPLPALRIPVATICNSAEYESESAQSRPTPHPNPTVYRALRTVVRLVAMARLCHGTGSATPPTMAAFRHGRPHKTLCLFFLRPPQKSRARHLSLPALRDPQQQIYSAAQPPVHAAPTRPVVHLAAPQADRRPTLVRHLHTPPAVLLLHVLHCVRHPQGSESTVAHVASTHLVAWHGHPQSTRNSRFFPTVSTFHAQRCPESVSCPPIADRISRCAGPRCGSCSCDTPSAKYGPHCSTCRRAHPPSLADSAVPSVNRSTSGS